MLKEDCYTEEIKIQTNLDSFHIQKKYLYLVIPSEIIANMFKIIETKHIT